MFIDAVLQTRMPPDGTDVARRAHGMQASGVLLFVWSASRPSYTAIRIR
jgi:hypothetical protein